MKLSIHDGARCQAAGLASLRAGDYTWSVMSSKGEKIPDPKELEKELGQFLAKKFGGTVKLATPIVMSQEMPSDEVEKPAPRPAKKINFDLKPEDLVTYLDQYIVKQDEAKAILATKICTHFNRIRYWQKHPGQAAELVGGIKNNVLMLGPTGVGKTYMIRLIAQKIGVPFVKGDATKFSETGYVGGDVEDLVRDLVREADGDIQRAQYGIIYIDEIDKIAASKNLVGADVSRTGVQRALLKPMEETEVDLKVPHDPISMLQEIERFRKTGKRDKNTINTRHILFIMSGAFSGLEEIIRKRLSAQSIGFSARVDRSSENHLLAKVKSEDLIEFGFESEFIGRLPVRTVFEPLTEEDLYSILANPNNPIILGKKLDFAAYGIAIKFAPQALRLLARQGCAENTGARGLVSAVERALMIFERKLPSAGIEYFPVTQQVLQQPDKWLAILTDRKQRSRIQEIFQQLRDQEIENVALYLEANRSCFSQKYGIPLTAERIRLISRFYCRHIMDTDKVLKTINGIYEQIKTMEMLFLKKQGITVVLEEEAIDYLIERALDGDPKNMDALYREICSDFEYGLKLVRDKTGTNRFFITRQALVDPENFIGELLQAGRNKSQAAGQGPKLPSLP